MAGTCSTAAAGVTVTEAVIVATWISAMLVVNVVVPRIVDSVRSLVLVALCLKNVGGVEETQLLVGLTPLVGESERMLKFIAAVWCRCSLMLT